MVYSEDRLSRFGNDLLRLLFKYFGAKFTVDSNKGSKSDEEELAEDLLSIVTVFTARYYGSRKYKNNEENKILPISRSKKIS